MAERGDESDKRGSLRPIMWEVSNPAGKWARRGVVPYTRLRVLWPARGPPMPASCSISRVTSMMENATQVRLEPPDRGA